MLTKKKMKHINNLLTRAMEFEHSKYSASFRYNEQTQSINCNVFDKKTYAPKITFYFYADVLNCKDLSKLVKSIESIFDKIENCDDIKTVRNELTLDSFNYVDISELVKK